MWSFPDFIWWSRSLPSCLGFSTLRQRSWMSHVLTVGTWPWRCCAPDTSSLDVGVSPLLCPVLVPPEEDYFGSGPGWFEDHSESFPVEYVSAGLSLLEHIAPSGVPGWVCGVLGQGGAQHLIRCPSRWRFDHCIGGWARFWRGRFGCAASVRKSSVARVRSRTDRYAFPGRWEHRAAL